MIIMRSLLGETVGTLVKHRPPTCRLNYNAQRNFPVMLT